MQPALHEQTPAGSVARSSARSAERVLNGSSLLHRAHLVTPLQQNGCHTGSAKDPSRKHMGSKKGKEQAARASAMDVVSTCATRRSSTAGAPCRWRITSACRRMSRHVTARAKKPARAQEAEQLAEQRRVVQQRAKDGVHLAAQHLARGERVLPRDLVPGACGAARRRVSLPYATSHAANGCRRATLSPAPAARPGAGFAYPMPPRTRQTGTIARPCPWRLRGGLARRGQG